MTCDAVLNGLVIGALMIVGMSAVVFVVFCFGLGLRDLIDRWNR